MARLAVAGAAENVQASEEQQLVIVRQRLSIGRAFKDRAQRGCGFFDPDRAEHDRCIRHFALGRNGMKVILYRVNVEIVPAVAEEPFGFFLLHVILRGARSCEVCGGSFAVQMPLPSKQCSRPAFAARLI
ncbi:hypothetical protein AU467_32075 [Mesorhizobium loti]|uniref:Uncharacterized protein n=1 Tax=Rhizobium loti TaxID=381 RepID=A0A101KNE4_RHILI|nr:hypothetical protein AU467_32075 [Mesorhizobium loti]